MSGTPLALLSLGVALRSATPLSATLEPVAKMYTKYERPPDPSNFVLCLQIQ